MQARDRSVAAFTMSGCGRHGSAAAKRAVVLPPESRRLAAEIRPEQFVGPALTQMPLADGGGAIIVGQDDHKVRPIRGVYRGQRREQQGGNQHMDIPIFHFCLNSPLLLHVRSPTSGLARPRRSSGLIRP